MLCQLRRRRLLISDIAHDLSIVLYSLIRGREILAGRERLRFGRSVVPLGTGGNEEYQEQSGQVSQMEAVHAIILLSGTQAAGCSEYSYLQIMLKIYIKCDGVGLIKIL
jgi:hypothetical protein